MTYFLDIIKIIVILVILSIFGINILLYLSIIGENSINFGLHSIYNLFGIQSNTKTNILDKGIQELKELLDIKVYNVQKIDKDYDKQNIEDKIYKSGFCYIGTENNNRHCIQVSSNDKCMSGDIFPSRDICINPALRL